MTTTTTDDASTRDREIQLFKETFGCSFNDRTFSDAVIESEGHQFHVHKIVLAAHSPVMKQAFSGNWKESKKGLMMIEGEPAAVVEAMLTYMYNFTYIPKDIDKSQKPESDQLSKPTDSPAQPNPVSQPSTIAQARGTPLLFHAKVYAIAEIYDMPSLKHYSREQFNKALEDGGWETDEFALAVTEVYTSTPDTDRGLRELVVAKTHQKVKILMDHGGFKALLREVVGFAAELSEALAGGPAGGSGKWYKGGCTCYGRTTASYYYIRNDSVGAQPEQNGLYVPCHNGNYNLHQLTQATKEEVVNAGRTYDD